MNYNKRSLASGSSFISSGIDTAKNILKLTGEANIEDGVDVGVPGVFTTGDGVGLDVGEGGSYDVDKDGNDVQQGETGELWFSGLGMTPGYFQNPEPTAEALTADGWLRSGDLGRQDEDGYYYIVSRLKDMYISGGENVYAA